MDVALVAALALARAERLTGREIAEQAWYLETVEAKIPGGKQDQFAAALGGFQRLTFRDPDVGIEPITLDPAFATALERRTVLCYTGRSRVSGATIARVMAAYERGDPRVTGALRAIKDVAAAMAEALRAGDAARVATLLSDNWTHQQTLDPAMRTPEMAGLESALKTAGAARPSPGSGTTVIGPATSTFGSRSAPRTWRRWRHSATMRERSIEPTRFCRLTASATFATPTATTCWGRAACSSPRTSNPSGSATTSRRPHCCAPAASSRMPRRTRLAG